MEFTEDQMIKLEDALDVIKDTFGEDSDECNLFSAVTLMMLNRGHQMSTPTEISIITKRVISETLEIIKNSGLYELHMTKLIKTGEY